MLAPSCPWPRWDAFGCSWLLLAGVWLLLVALLVCPWLAPGCSWPCWAWLAPGRLLAGSWPAPGRLLAASGCLLAASPELLAAPGYFLAAPGCPRLASFPGWLLLAPGCSWPRWAAFCCFWLLLVAPGRWSAPGWLLALLHLTGSWLDLACSWAVPGCS